MPSALVVGGGYAGLQAARQLDALLGRGWIVTLIDRSPCHQLLTRLPEVVRGTVAPTRACVPFHRILGRRLEVVRAEVFAVDPISRRVELAAGPRRGDFLVVALGMLPDDTIVPGASEHSTILRSVTAAVRLKTRLSELCEQDRDVRVAIIGAGYTGTEIAGELASWDAQLRAAGSPSRISVTVIAQDEHLLPEGNERLAHVAEVVLRAKGVVFRLGHPVKEVTARSVVITDGSEAVADVVVWAARAEPPPPLRRDGWVRGPDHRIEVDPYLRAVGVEGVYVAGDVAMAYDYARDAPVGGTAQLAVQEGAAAAQNLVAEARGSKLHEFRPRPLGQALSLGNGDGAAEVAGVVVTGRRAAWIKQAALLRYLRSLGGAKLALEYR